MFFLGALSFIVFWNSQNGALIRLASGGLIEFIAAVNFYLYGKTSLQLADFQSRLDLTQRYLLANSICEGLEKTAKQTARSTLVSVISGGNSNVSDSTSKTTTVKLEEND